MPFTLFQYCMLLEDIYPERFSRRPSEGYDLVRFRFVCARARTYMRTRTRMRACAREKYSCLLPRAVTIHAMWHYMYTLTTFIGNSFMFPTFRSVPPDAVIVS